MTALDTAQAGMEGDLSALAEFGVAEPVVEPGTSAAALIRERQALLVHALAEVADDLVGTADPTPPWDSDPDLVTDDS